MALNAREREFVLESDRLEFLRPDLQEPQSGHVESFEDARRAALAHEPLTGERLHRWGRLLDAKVGDATALQTLSAALEGKRLSAATDIVARAALIGESLVRLQDAAGSGRLARLVANFFLISFDAPVVVFRASERSVYDAARTSDELMKAYAADKLREVAKHPRTGEIAIRQSTHGATDRYATASGAALLVEYHELAEAVEAWRARRGG